MSLFFLCSNVKNFQLLYGRQFVFEKAFYEFSYSCFSSYGKDQKVIWKGWEGRYPLFLLTFNCEQKALSKFSKFFYIRRNIPGSSSSRLKITPFSCFRKEEVSPFLSTACFTSLARSNRPSFAAHHCTFHGEERCRDHHCI